MEIKEVLEALSLPADLDNTEAIVEAHRKNYLLVTEAHEHPEVKKKIEGALIGPLKTAVKREFSLESEEMKDKSITDIVMLGAVKFKGKIKELEDGAGSGSDEKVKKASEDLAKAITQRDQYKTDLEKSVRERDELQAGFEGKLKSFKVENVLKDAKAKLVFADGTKEVEKIGFNAIIGSKYKIEVDENENPVITTLDGNKVPNKKKTGSYLSVEEVLNIELEAQGLAKKNNATIAAPRAVKQNDGQTTDRTKKGINPRAVAAADHYARTAGQ